MIYYACSYVPLEILKATGIEFKRIDGKEVQEDNYIHRNICGYCKSVYSYVNKLEDGDVFISVDSCDAMRRIGDVIPETSRADVYTIRLPWKNDSNAVSMMELELRGLVAFLEERFDIEITHEKLLEGMSFFRKLREHITGLHMKDVDYSLLAKAMEDGENGKLNNATEKESVDERPRIGVFGGITNSLEMNEIVKSAGGKLILNDSCKGLRTFTGNYSDEEPLKAISKRLMTSRIPCGRFHSMKSEDYRKLIEDFKIEGMIYIQPKFCDFYGFAIADLNPGIPFISIEQDYPTEDSGQARTRIGAFIESMKGGSKSSMLNYHKYYVGVDSGSTTTNLVLIDNEGEIVSWKIARTGLNGGRTAEGLLNDIVSELNINIESIGCCIATGYGRGIIDFADDTVTEISCHAKGAKQLFPDANTVIDIGGQDSKVIKMDYEGKVVDFAMNDKCAAGTGRFLEVMSGVLETDLDSMAKISQTASKSVPISSMCTVFAESEVVSLIGRGEKLENISAGLFDSISKRITAMYKRVKGTPPLIFTGGVARNQGVVKAIEKLLKTSVLIPDIPDIVGAYGAALFAREKGGK